MAYTVINGKLTKTPGKNPVGPYGKPYVKKETQHSAQPNRKGLYMGLCNRSACLAPGPTWWNTGSRAYYCGRCAMDLNIQGCQKFGEPDICFKVTGFDLNNQPQFDPLAEKDYYAEYRLRPRNVSHL